MFLMRSIFTRGILDGGLCVVLGVEKRVVWTVLEERGI